MGILAARVDNKLALEGGRPVRTSPMPPWPHFEADEVEAAASVLRSGKVNYWTGMQGQLFEQEFAESVGCPHALAVANGTVALELALQALGVGPGDEVVVPSRSFVASASCAVMRGARPVFADVDADSQNLTAETIRAALSERTKAIIAVHLAGWPCDMDAILSLTRARNLKVIEDCAQAHGATYKGRPIGSLGDMAAFSFCQDKIMTTGGEGGMVVTRDPNLWEKAWSFRDHGRRYDAKPVKSTPWEFRWLRDSFGTNWRMTEMQSALGRNLLRKLPQFVEIRRRNAAILSGAFSKIPGLRVTLPPAGIGHSYYKYYAFVRPAMLADDWSRDRILAAINAEGIPCYAGSCSEIYLEKAFAQGMRPVKRLAVARALGDTSLMFMVHPTLHEEDMMDMCLAVEKVMKAATLPNLPEAS